AGAASKSIMLIRISSKAIRDIAISLSVTPGSSGSAWAACQPIALIIENPIITPNDANQEAAQLKLFLPS
ncbi:MAG: hypothetical protein ACREXO_04500, partial [Advenella sp.]